MRISRTGPSIHIECFFPQQVRPEQYGSLEAGGLIEKLKDLKTENIELKYFSDCRPDSLIRTIDILRQAGMAVSIHGKWGKNPSPRSFSECFPVLADLPRDEEILITTHPLEADGSVVDRSQLAIRNARAYKDLSRILRMENRRHRIAIELQRQKKASDYGATYGDLVTLLEDVDDENFGICWDFGHAYYNTLEWNLHELPPEEFLRNTIHTHIHSIYKGITHFSLSQGDLPLERWVRLLLEADYNGLFILELIEDRMGELLTWPEQIFSEFTDSREKLARLIRTG